MATALNILERVQAYGYGGDTKTVQLSMLNDVYRRVMNYRRWRFNSEHAELFTTSSGEAEYTMDEGKRIDALRGPSVPLAHRDYQQLRDEQLYSGTEKGEPRYWTQYGGKVILYPTPDAAYKITGDVTKKIEPLVEATTLAIPDDHSQILVWGTIIAIAYRERDWEGHNYARQMYQEALAEMAAEWGMTNRQTSSQVVASGSLDRYDAESMWPL